MQKNVLSSSTSRIANMSTATAGKQLIQAPQLGQTIQVTPRFQSTPNHVSSITIPTHSVTSLANIVSRDGTPSAQVPTIPVVNPINGPGSNYRVIRTMSPVKTKYKNLLSPISSVILTDTSKVCTPVTSDVITTPANNTQKIVIKQPLASRSPSKQIIAPVMRSIPNNVSIGNIITPIAGLSSTGNNQVKLLRVLPSTKTDGTTVISHPKSVMTATTKSLQTLIKQEVPQQTVKFTVQQQPAFSTAKQRVILPATAKQLPIRQASIMMAADPSQLASGGTTFVSSNNGLFCLKQMNTPVSIASTTTTSTRTQQSSLVATSRLQASTAISSLPQNAMAKTPTQSTDGNSAARPRKPCNCTKSQCLKLYCDCFASGEFCSNCNCTNCANNLDHEADRAKAIKSCRDRNPLAFHPKIGKGKGGIGERRHQKGCNCKRSGCLKNYCECYEAKILCSSSCKCLGCKNYEEGDSSKTLMSLADAAEVREQQQTAAKSRGLPHPEDLPGRRPPVLMGDRSACSLVTYNVAEATCSCLIAQAEEAERTRQLDMTTEQQVLKEFGRCLQQVIMSADKRKAIDVEEDDLVIDSYPFNY